MKRYTNKVRILLFCLISIAIIHVFDFTGLYRISMTEAASINNSGSTKPLLYAEKNTSQLTTLQKQAPSKTAGEVGILPLHPVVTNTSSSATIRALIRALPCIGGLPCGTWKISLPTCFAYYSTRL